MRVTGASIGGTLGRAAVGAGGALAVDAIMGQAARFLPPSLSARYTAAGGMNIGYYGTKLAIALALGIGGAKFAPGRFKATAARMAEGSLTVQAYEIGRALLPAAVTLGYYNPARIVANPQLAGMRGGVRAYLPSRIRGLRASFGAGSAGSGSRFSEARIGEGSVD